MKLNHATRELTAAMPRLRRDLRVHDQQERGVTVHVIEDALTGRYYSAGEREYRFLRALDGTRTVSEVVGRFSQDGGAGAMSLVEATTLVRALADAGLLESGGAGHARRLREDLDREQSQDRWVGRTKGILFPRFSLGNPDEVLTRIAPWFGWISSKWFFALWLMVVVSGGWQIHAHWGRFWDELSGLFEVGNILLLGVLWIALKAFHEGWHAVGCKRFGGAVPEIGVVMFMLITPMGYVNASSAARFPSKWQRIFVSAAGMYGEIFLAGLAAWCWAATEPGLMSAALHKIVVISSVTTVLFNANPLMRFDGYYILSDLLETPNLGSKGQSAAAFAWRRLLFGAKPDCHPLSTRERQWWIPVYGMLSFSWRIVVVAGIVLTVGLQWGAAGLVLGAVLVGASIYSLGSATRKYFARRARTEGVEPWKAAGRSGLAAAALVVFASLIEISPSVLVPGIVVPREEGDLRVECPGFVEELMASPGDPVFAGQVLLRLRNVEEETRLRQLELELGRTMALADLYREAENIAAFQAEWKEVRALQERLAEVQSHVATLELRAPVGGTLVALEWSNLQGSYLEEGTRIGSVGSSDSKSIAAAVSQEQIEVFAGREGALGRVIARGKVLCEEAGLLRVVPHASETIPHFGLTAVAGGPLPVKHRVEEEGSPEMAEDRLGGDALIQRYQLVKPYFQVQLSLSESGGRRLREGELVYVRFWADQRDSLPVLAWNWMGKRFREVAEGEVGP